MTKAIYRAPFQAPQVALASLAQSGSPELQEAITQFLAVADGAEISADDLGRLEDSIVELVAPISPANFGGRWDHPDQGENIMRREWLALTLAQARGHRDI